MYFQVFIKLFSTKRGKNKAILEAPDLDPEPDPVPSVRIQHWFCNNYYMEVETHHFRDMRKLINIQCRDVLIFKTLSRVTGETFFCV
jgi:hypothetical protein